MLRRVPEFARDKSPIPRVLRAVMSQVFSLDSTDKPLISKRQGLFEHELSYSVESIYKGISSKSLLWKRNKLLVVIQTWSWRSKDAMHHDAGGKRRALTFYFPGRAASFHNVFRMTLLSYVCQTRRSKVPLKVKLDRLMVFPLFFILSMLFCLFFTLSILF